MKKMKNWRKKIILLSSVKQKDNFDFIQTNITEELFDICAN